MTKVLTICWLTTSLVLNKWAPVILIADFLFIIILFKSLLVLFFYLQLNNLFKNLNECIRIYKTATTKDTLPKKMNNNNNNNV